MDRRMVALVQELKPLLPFILTIPLLSLFLLLKRVRKPYPPRPKGWPLFGCITMMNQLTHHGLAKLAKQYDDIFHLRIGFLHIISVSSPNVAQQVLQVQDHVFSNRPANNAVTYLTYNRSDLAFAHYGPFWRQMRKLCVMKLFSPRRTESWDSVRVAMDDMITAVAAGAGTAVSVGELIFGLSTSIVYRAAFGSSSREGQDEFIKILQEFSELFGAFNIADSFWGLGWMDRQGLTSRMRKARASLDRFIDTVIEDHEAKRKDVMFGGTETIASGVEWTLSELLRRPQHLKRVQQELADVVGLDRQVEESDIRSLTYFNCCIKDALRLHPPIPILLHETAADATINGYHIPKKSRVMVNVWAISRDNSVWEHPEAFKPERFLRDDAPDFKGRHFEFITFGLGRRYCPGMQLGLYTVEMAVARLLHSFTWELPEGMKPGELPMEDIFGLATARSSRLVAVPKPRLTFLRNHGGSASSRLICCEINKFLDPCHCIVLFAWIDNLMLRNKLNVGLHLSSEMIGQYVIKVI